MTVKLFGGIALALLLAGCGSPGGADAQDESLADAVTSRFDFHSDRTINLHHFLYQWARGLEPLDDVRVPIEVAERGQSDRLTREELEAWEAGVDFYRRELVTRSLLFDDEMIELRDALAGKLSQPGDEGLFETVGLLESLGPIYERHWWPQHDASNRAWIRALLPRLRELEGEIGTRLAEAYGGRWPSELIRVDVSAYANHLGAYTTAEPHITISSSDPGYTMPWALEMLFHEASHGTALHRPLREALESEFSRRSRGVPRRLGHVLIFYTAGELTRQVLSESGQRNYEPYADYGGLYARVPDWAIYREAAERHWKPWLDGEIDRQAALARLAEVLSARVRAEPN